MTLRRNPDAAEHGDRADEILRWLVGYGQDALERRLADELARGKRMESILRKE